MPMERMTFTVPADLKRRARRLRGVNWSGIVQQALEERLRALEMADRILADSRLTEADVEEISKKINSGMLRHYKRHRRRGSP